MAVIVDTILVSLVTLSSENSPIKVRTSPNGIVAEVLRVFLTTEIF